VQHTVFVPDEFSVDQRSDAAQAAGWRGIVMWAMGYETDFLYTVLAS
jgi:spore germination protein YaaH